MSVTCQLHVSYMSSLPALLVDGREPKVEVLLHLDAEFRKRGDHSNVEVALRGEE